MSFIFLPETCPVSYANGRLHTGHHPQTGKSAKAGGGKITRYGKRKGAGVLDRRPCATVARSEKLVSQICATMAREDVKMDRFEKYVPGTGFVWFENPTGQLRPATLKDAWEKLAESHRKLFASAAAELDRQWAQSSRGAVSEAARHLEHKAELRAHRAEFVQKIIGPLWDEFCRLHGLSPMSIVWHDVPEEYFSLNPEPTAIVEEP
jgi:hypothetical protein